MKIGILLINLGTPSAANRKAVAKYLREFLSDARVIELPFLLRWILVNLIIVPTRAKKSAHAYASIWGEAGSPLRTNSIELQAALQDHLGPDYYVALGMRYGAPSIANALEELHNAGVSKLLILPLFPQYASATNGSAIEKTLKILAKRKEIIPSTILSDLSTEYSYIEALAASVKPFITADQDFILFSYHGLPQRQLINPGKTCYRTKCIQNATQLAQELDLPANKWAVSFQSRLGKLPWIQPYTEHKLKELRNDGVENLLVICPSFIVDCLETLEEIGLRAKQDWLDLGGKSLQLIPCLNAQPQWVNALAGIVKKNLALV